MAVLEEFGLAIVSIFASGTVGVIISILYHNHTVIRRLKLNVLQRIMENRFDITGEGFLKALNAVVVVYSDSKKVLSALKEYHEYSMASVKSQDLANQKILDLFIAMSENLNIDIKPLTDTFFLYPFKVANT